MAEIDPPTSEQASMPPDPHSPEPDTQTIDDLFNEACARAGFPTDDVLTAFLSLARQANTTHAVDKVAPLEGLAELKVDSGRIFFHASSQQQRRRQDYAIQCCEQQAATNMDVVDHVRSETNSAGVAATTSVRVAKSDETITRPIFTNGYVCWEHALGHHDPLTDIFCLGQILATLACGIDFRDIEDVQKFAMQRPNLFQRKPDLHPVIAQAIFRMTELNRSDRVQDLPALIHTLENYREATAVAEFDPELSVLPSKAASKNEMILRRLRERLFDISRRNRLLNFSPTMATINLTQSSVPLTLDPGKVDLSKLLTASNATLEQLGGGKAISLSGYINFQEALYAPNVLNRIITDDRRERAEFGFGGLRLAMAFLNWSNVKVKPAEHYHSPLVLVGVTLKRKKGVRDKYLLEATDSDAEINPVLRHLMSQLYGIQLPETIPLKAGAIAELAESLRRQISSSESSIQLDVIERPQIELIQAKAEKRLQLYKKRARVSGRGVRHFGDLQYSYDPANYHPLGIRLFEHKVRFPETHLDVLTRRHVPPRRNNMVADGDSESRGDEKTLYRWKEGGTGNPYHWQVDLCNITLASFRYRRMSLVRDYDAMLSDPIQNEAFEALVSSKPQTAGNADTEKLSVSERFDVVPCDPTQASAVAEARRGENYIVQGPPGTGKSQTITNLIADYVARGKRVLFVCEKRAAIDVVYARLKAIGLAPVSCLIHDAQADKKEFIADLKETYQMFLDDRLPSTETRNQIQSEIRSELACLENVHDLFTAENESAGMSLRELLDRCLALKSDLPEITPLQAEQLPCYSDWIRSRSVLKAISEKMKPIRSDGIVAREPLASLRSDVANQEQPLAFVQNKLSAAKRSLSAIIQRLSSSGIVEEAWSSVEQVNQVIDYAETALPLAEADLMEVAEVGNTLSGKINKQVRELQRLSDAVTQAAAKNKHWTDKLSPQDTESALVIAKNLAGKMTNLLNPNWWRLRGVIRRSYNFQAHAVRPDWVSLLLNLKDEHDKRVSFDAKATELQQSYGMKEDPLLWTNRINRLMREFTNNEQLRPSVHRPIMKARNPSEAMRQIADAKPMVDNLCDSLDSITDSWRSIPTSKLGEHLDQLEASLTNLPKFLTVMESLEQLPSRVSWAVRHLAMSQRQVEAAVANRTYRNELNRHPAVESFSGGTRSAHAVRLGELYDEWLQSNSLSILSTVGKQFLKHVAESDDPTPTTREDRNQRRSYKKGQRELEHEFGKQMRFKPIRTLLSNDSRKVIIDLKPVWLMSPLSVSDTLPLVDDLDVVIFDEASQVTLQEAVPALCRGKQVIVVGDQMQLPPTNFFASKTGDEESNEFVFQDSDGEDVSYDLSSASFLSFADRGLQSTMLGWHYRSRSESLISFSNWRFYDGQLLTVPEEYLSRESDSSVSSSLFDRPVSFHLIENGCYENRRNRFEADHIANLVRSLLCDTPPDDARLPRHPTIGVIAFSEAQQSEIQSALARLAEDDLEFAARLDEESIREENGQFVGLLVKNLENIQGDERDIVLLSVCYGPDPQGRVRMNFGPINKSGGEKRLNVAFSRAKHHMAIVSSIRYTAITNDYNTGASTLKDYLQYADALSNQRHDETATLLKRLSRRVSQDPSSPKDNVLKRQVAEALHAEGWSVGKDVGQSRFRIDLAIANPGDKRYRLGILLDDDGYFGSECFERDVQRPRLLEEFGWKITYILAKDWYDDPAAELARIRELASV